MDSRQRADLDNYITGHYGEDQFRDEPRTVCEEAGHLYLPQEDNPKRFVCCDCGDSYDDDTATAS